MSRRQRRGVGTVIATVIFIFVFIFTMGQLYVWYLNQLDDYNAVVDRMRDSDAARLNEAISISSVSITTGNALTIQVVNRGSATAHIVSLWVIDETANPDTRTRTSVDVYVPAAGTNTVSGTGTFGHILSLKVVTELGTVVSHRIAPASGIGNLAMSLVASPPTVVEKHSVALSLFVTNNNTSYDSLYDLKITPASDISYTYSSTGESISLTPPSVTTVSSILKGETVVFTWLYTINAAAPGETFTFKGRYTGASSFASVAVKVVTPFGTDTSSSIQNILGSVRAVHGSLQWAIRNPKTQTSGFTWNSGWQVNKADYLVFRINLTNDGAQNVRLSADTAFYLQRLETSTFVQLYIVKEAGGTISTYDGSVVLLANSANVVTVYFAVDEAGDNPSQGGNSVRLGNEGTFGGFIGVFGTLGSTPYGQLIPFQAVKSIA